MTEMYSFFARERDLSQLLLAVIVQFSSRRVSNTSVQFTSCVSADCMQLML